MIRKSVDQTSGAGCMKKYGTFARGLAVVRRKIAFLPGEISFVSERVTVITRSEKSAEAVVAVCIERKAERVGKPEVMSLKRAWHQKLGNWAD